METPITPNGPHQPSVDDVFAVKNTLFKYFRLPAEIIDVVIDFAEYWPCTSTLRTGGQPVTIRAGEPKAENQFILRSYPLGYTLTKDSPTKFSLSDNESFPTIPPQPWLVPAEFPKDVTAKVVAHMLKKSQIRGLHPCRKVVFTIQSHDQGWGGTRDQRGTYKGSYTWFEAGLERLTAFQDTNISLDNEKSTDGLTIPKWQPVDEESSDDMKVDLLPQLPITLDTEDETNNTAEREKSPTVCTLHTISPKIESRTTAHEPPRVESWFSHELMPSTDCLQRNRTASRDLQTNAIEWRYDDNTNPESVEAKNLIDLGRGPSSKTGDYIRNLKVGDAVTVWAKARFPMWVNTVEEVKIDVYYAV